jgi:hypothetical protein
MHFVTALVLHYGEIHRSQNAMLIADQHEQAENRHGQPRDEELMDTANNAAGRICAADSGKNCWDACTDLYNKGRLFGLGARPLIP